MPVFFANVMIRKCEAYETGELASLVPTLKNSAQLQLFIVPCSRWQDHHHVNI